MINVVTHDGQFHQDEIFACVLLSYFTGDELKIKRTRKENIISKAQADVNTFVLDVGFKYEPHLNNLDHHQSTFDERADNGDLYSSCGIMWKKLRDTVGISDFIKGKIDEFTNKIDRQDNGVEFFKEVEFLSLYNFEPLPKSENIQDKRFAHAYKAACAYFANLMSLWAEQEERDKVITEAIKHASGGIIFSENKISINEKINATDNKLVVSRRREGEYAISSLNATDVVDYSVRCGTPMAWRGLSEDELCNVSGFDGMIFCHKNGFFTVVRGDKDHAIKVANHIIENGVI